MKAFFFGPGCFVPLVSFRRSTLNRDQHMNTQLILTLAGLTAFVASAPAQFASTVEAFDAGVGGSAGFDDPSAAVGSPSVDTPGEFGGPVTPFAAPYLAEQIVSIGEGGSLTVQLSEPVQNHSLNPFGLDLLVFGGTFFLDTDYPNGVADGEGSIFGAADSTRVWVGNDLDNLYLLNPSLAPVIDGMFPTDGAGDFQLPVDPSLQPGDFANLTLAEIRALYNGSGGGAGFDLSWAVDGDGNPVALDSVSYVRIDVLSGKAEIDAFAAVSPVPEPSTIVLGSLGLTVLLFACRKRLG